MIAARQVPDEYSQPQRVDRMAEDKGSTPDFIGSRANSASAGSGQARTIMVKAGDNLSKIALHELGDATRWRAIYEANRHQIADPDHLDPGIVLTIPSGPSSP
jgi:nucleoid-associated protein YgaU